MIGNAPVVICTRALSRPVRRPWAPAAIRLAVARELMRLSRQSFDRGLAGDFRPMRAGGPRRLLPLV